MNSLTGRAAKASVEAPDRVVSHVIVAGALFPLSRYSDPVWELTGFPTNVQASARRLNFGRVPAIFRDTAKRAIYRYREGGRRNRQRPTDASVLKVFGGFVHFFRYLERVGIRNLASVNAAVCGGYVDATRMVVKPGGKALALGTIQLRLQAVEILYDVTSRDKDGLQKHPWPDSSAQILADVVGPNSNWLASAKTPVIPDRLLVQLFQAAQTVLQRAPSVMDLRDEWQRSEDARNAISVGSYHYKYNVFLASRGWSGGALALRRALTEIRTACYIVIASLSGCRNHELSYMRRGAVRSSVKDGERYWWLRSKSTKTHIGECEWMIPIAAVEAIRVLERWAAPYHKQIEAEAHAVVGSDTRAAEVAEAALHEQALFLSKGNRTPVTADHSVWARVLDEFARNHGIQWRPRTHQFRRTFAVYAARSSLGDLRYLKKHFKHWSMDMTLVYALSEYQEHDLISDIAAQVDVGKRAVIAEWMEPGARLAGGGGRRLTSFRSANPVRLYKSRSDMINAIAKSVHIRSNGHAWCTADRGVACSGNSGMDATRCSTCAHAVIGERHASFYMRARNDLAELLSLDDIGESGKERVLRDIARCDEVINDLMGE